MTNHLIGQRFGKLVVIALSDAYVSPSGCRKRNWSCLCDCGVSKVIQGTSLKRGLTRSCGCLHREPRAYRQVAVPKYRSLHNRLDSQRGKASQYPCTDCGEQAAEWSYDHSDPDEIHCTPQAGRAEVEYSLKLEHYFPRCKSCHTRFDSKVGVMA